MAPGLLGKFNSFKKNGGGLLKALGGALKGIKKAKSLEDIMEIVEETNGAVDDFLDFVAEEKALAA